MVEGGTTPVIKICSRKSALKKYSPSFEKPQSGGGASNVTFGASNQNQATCRETAWGVSAPQDAHWMAWSTGELETPGKQTQLIKPYPSPEPPNKYGTKNFTNYPKPKTLKTTKSGSLLTARGHDNRNCLVRSMSAGQTNPDIHVNNFRSWHNSSPSDYEKAVTYNMLSHLYGEHAPKLDKMRRNKPGRYEHPINFERRLVKDTYRQLSSMDSSMNVAQSYGGRRSAIDYYPVSHHSTKYKANDCTNTSSFFMYTKPTIKGSFVIHPDFVSENAQFSKNLKHLGAAKGKDGFRYGSSLAGV